MPWTAEYAHVSAEALAHALGGLVSDVDKAALIGEFAQSLLDSFREGTRAGVWGWLDDDLAFTVDWGFDLGSIHVPVVMWQGHRALMVPPAHGRWLMQRVPTDRTYMEAEHGHLSLYVGSFGVLLDEMLEASRAA